MPLPTRLTVRGETRPWWLGDPGFHAGHRSNLLRKDPDHYSRFGWLEPDDLPYVWSSAEPPVSRSEASHV